MTDQMFATAGAACLPMGSTFCDGFAGWHSASVEAADADAPLEILPGAVALVLTALAALTAWLALATGGTA
ncbi:hypothetical protein [Neotabrizicola sp. sgz301269]|uniref:hypothetical protein n=1 Tax=Neotabrizicola sp. sgz301269 TaxID=3276282 RepID=UPI00376FFB54